MVDQQEQSGVAVRHSIVVKAPQDRAFTVFTQRMQSWWPMESHRIGGKPITDLVTEPRAGGRWYEIGEDGSEQNWGRVLGWERPDRILLAWQLNADWTYDPDFETTVEVRFTEDDGHVVVDFEHRDLERFGDRAAQVRGDYESGMEGGWSELLARYQRRMES